MVIINKSSIIKGEKIKFKENKYAIIKGEHTLTVIETKMPTIIQTVRVK